jgi:hypothetical protein
VPLTNPWLSEPAPTGKPDRAQLDERILNLQSAQNMCVLATTCVTRLDVIASCGLPQHEHRWKRNVVDARHQTHGVSTSKARVTSWHKPTSARRSWKPHPPGRATSPARLREADETNRPTDSNNNMCTIDLNDREVRGQYWPYDGSTLPQTPSWKPLGRSTN